MKRTTTFLLSLLLLSTTVFAVPIDPEKAFEIANDVWNSTTGTAKTTLKQIPRARMAKAGSRIKTDKKNPGFYVFAPENEQGFVIVSGDDALTPVIGYSTSGTAGEMPTALCDLLNVYDMYVDDVRNGIVEPVQCTAAPTGVEIAPLLTTTWNQSAPYNNMCPTINGTPAPTGCTATAMAQVMKFHNWPEKPSKNITWYNNTTQKEEIVNTTSHRYNWTKMLDSYTGGYTTEESDAVALLMSDVGRAIQSNYELSGTGSTSMDAAQALVNIFRYSPDIVVANRREYSDEEYIALIVDNLNARQPLVYAGYGQNFSSGHAFVCDGINASGYLHINWGWGGAYDGYFDITSMAPGGAGIGGGEDRYNVGQSIVANIRPRTNDEADANGAPTIWSQLILDPDTDPDKGEDYRIIDEYNGTFKNNTAGIRVAFALINLSHSASNMQLAMMFEKDGEIYSGATLNSSDDLIELGINEQTDGHYIIGMEINNNPDGDFYLEEGTYKVRFYYSDGSEDGDFVLIRGNENDLVLEVTATSVKLCKSLPDIKVNSLIYHNTPSMKGDPISFDAIFENQNTSNSLVLIAPVLNRMVSENEYESDTLFNATAMVEVYDNQEIIATFKTGSIFPEDGRYHITFICNALNYYLEKNMEFDRNAIIPIDGRSQEVTISPLPDGVVLSATALNAAAITYGEKMNITGTVTNISTSDNSFTGRIGIFAKDNSTGKNYILATQYIEELAKDAKVNISYNLPDYLPVMQPGSYTISLYQLDDKGWKAMRQSAATCILDIAATNKTIPYIKEIMDINDGDDVVVQGESFNVEAKIGCLNGDLEGYARVNIPYGLSYHVRSEYVPLSVKKDGTANVTFVCSSKATTPLGKYRIAIIYYDSNKNKLGDMSNNTLTYSGNGYFWIGDATAIDKVESTGNATISSGNGYITITDADNAKVTIYSADGREVYNGYDTTVATGKGLYIVTVQSTDGTTSTAKLLVK